MTLDELPKEIALIFNELPQGALSIDELPERTARPGSQVPDLIDGASLVMVFGSTDVGKTWWVGDLALHLEQGLPYLGRELDPTLVVYLAYESSARFADRVRAWRARNGSTGNFVILAEPFDITDQCGSDALLERLHQIRRAMGMPIGLVVVDTLARAMNGADETSAVAMGAALRTFARIQATGATVTVIHHTGKRASEGPRGHSSLIAACDTVIKIEAGPAWRVATVTRQRDMPRVGEFRFKIVPDGNSARVEHENRAAESAIDADLAIVGLLADAVAVADAAGHPFCSSGKSGLDARRAELPDGLRGFGRPRLKAICTRAITLGVIVRKPSGALLKAA